ncbi:hypothetical protein [Caballeronia sp. LZ034LL]|uniref:hypothetical protein n=1 Tax=Caballeronia sp. LZ034LL TaxID=3038567 RepID=UPI0028560877|nr:hypothetical protein [Caballeronia sp. LZ034LL]MDR5833710.1 hypothetical protein [Caballeronia sp. LZ034LL]
MPYKLKSTVISASAASLAALVMFSGACEAASSVPDFIPETVLGPGAAPNGVVAVDENAVFVAATATNSSGASVAEVLIFGRVHNSLQQTGTVVLKSGDEAEGMSITPDKTTLVVALENSGVALVNVGDALAGKAEPSIVDQSNGGTISDPGTFGTAVTPDGKYAFIANEFGKITPTSPPGNVGLIALSKQRDGRTTGTAVGFIPVVGSTIADVSISADGQRAYATTEAVNDKNTTLSGTSNAALVSTQCVEDNPQAPTSNGALNVIDVAKAIAGAATPGSTPNVIRSAVLTTIAAACSPVRVQETLDGSSVWLTARGSNELLQFDRAKLTADPDNALLQTVPSNGLAPVGLYLDPVRPNLMITNSDRWNASPTSTTTPPVSQMNLSVFDISGPRAKLVQTLQTGAFPRAIATTDQEKTVFVTNYDDDTVSVFTQQDEGSVAGGAGISPFGFFGAQPQRR